MLHCSSLLRPCHEQVDRQPIRMVVIIGANDLHGQDELVVGGLVDVLASLYDRYLDLISERAGMEPG